MRARSRQVKHPRFKIVLFKQILLKLVLWNKQATLKEQGYNNCPQINIPLKFFQINHRPLIIMDGCNKCFEVNTVSLTNGSLQVLPWNNDTTIEKMSCCDWYRKITDFFQYTHSWNQQDVIISTPYYNFCSAKPHQIWKNALLQLFFYNKKGHSSNGWLQLELRIKSMPFKHLPNTFYKRNSWL